MMRTRVLLIVGALAVMFGCLALAGLAGLVGTAAKDATQQALAGADSEGQRVTAVCIGLNIGSCRTSQASTSTRPASDAGDGIPWQVKLFAVAVICPLLLGGTILLCRDQEEW